ncbi:MAG TPA: succinic semialdehyde dehydrogenase [Candidatus Acidoferrales bacterium]|nr:succinic semialdehyde dehydrogenase [Candidatus Acidoferrales bacterium]
MAEAATQLRPELVPQRTVIPVTNPATMQKIADVPVTDADGVEAAVSHARAAQHEWMRWSFKERGAALKRYRDVVIDNKERVAAVISSETGRPRADVYPSELLQLCDAIGYWAKVAPKYLADETVRPHLLKNKKVYISYHPMGVIGIIGPWNFPFLLTIGEAIPALLAGNAVVIKPSEVTPLSAMLGAELAEQAGLPHGLLQVVPGYGETGGHLVDCADMICFTGSVATGRKVAERAAKRLIPVTLELGGKDAMVVLRDADLERAANGCVWGGLFNAGQVCMSVERVYVEEPIYDAFVSKVTEKVKQLRQGLPDQTVEVGSMTFPPQLQKVEQHVAEAVQKGAKLLAGGRRNPTLPGLFYEPTVLTDVTHDMAIMSEETFGPVIPIMKVRDAEEALRLTNDSRYGLTGSVWTKDRAKGQMLSRRIEAGSVCVNDCLVNFAVTEAPMGGVKESGLGARHGAQGIRKFCRHQTVVIDRFGSKSEINWYPTSKRKAALFRRVMNFYRSGWRNKLRG